MVATRRSSFLVPAPAADDIVRVTIARATLARARDREAETPAAPERSPQEQSFIAEQLRLCAQSFPHFLAWWRFRNRETGMTQSFGGLATDIETHEDRFVFDWPGQSQFAEAAAEHPWLFALKAGKLGFTEIECAYDAWVARFRQRNARIHIFSRVDPAAKELLAIVKYGLQRLPSWMRWPVLSDQPGGDTTRSFKLQNPDDADDVRSIVSYPATENVAIEESAQHIHLDEFSHMRAAKELWNSVSTTAAPGGTVHIVTRGAGPDPYSYELWRQAVSGQAEVYAFFVDWRGRPDRDETWYDLGLSTRTLAGQRHYAPENPEDAFAGDESNVYIPLEVWDMRHDPLLPPYNPGDRQPAVLALDAGVRKDLFGAVLATRHPQRNGDPAVRLCAAWGPDPVTGVVPFDEAERWIRFTCRGGCPAGHPKSLPLPDCEYCARDQWNVAGRNVLIIVYDEHQLADMAQRLARDRIAIIERFDQGRRRLVADSQLYEVAMSGRLAHNGDQSLRTHVGNARAKLQADEDSRMRIVKSAENRKVDLAVAASMAVNKILELRI